MNRSRTSLLAGFGLACFLSLANFDTAGRAEEPKNPKGVWTNPDDPTLPADFKIQGEYAGEIKGAGKLGCQVIALGKGAFQAVVYPGGLPGEGWDTHSKILMDGKLQDDKGVFVPTTGRRQYLAQAPDRFSATSKFPPAGQEKYTATIAGDTLNGKTEDGKEFELKKVLRKSQTLGASPPDGAIVLFDGKSAAEWTGGRVDQANGILNTDSHDLHSKRKFNNYTLHVEFMLPFKPDARSQGRANSGVYQVNVYEVQVLDSFGLDGKNNECGGVYSKVAPKVNMCSPPLVWQTYDIDFTNAVAEIGKKVKNARISMKHNGVVIHEEVAIDGPTEDPNAKEGNPGSIRLQGHGNPLQFRNIWIVEKK